MSHYIDGHGYVRNTVNDWNSLVPDHHKETELLEVPKPTGKGRVPEVQILLFFSGEEISRYTGVLVENRYHATFGKGKRRYQAEFTKQEREKISKLYAKAYGWVLRSGHPQHIQMAIGTYDLLVRAANFFSSI